MTRPRPRGSRSEHSARRVRVSALSSAVVAKHAATQEHSERVADMARALARRLGWTTRRCARLHEAALLHDVGKITVPIAILDKPGRLTEDEYAAVKAHSLIGARMVQDVLDPEQVSWIRSHHERPDGHGYPDALNAGDIPQGALIIGVADAYDAITSHRSYRPARSAREALGEMRAHAGTQFDTHLLDLLHALIEPEPAG